jgi:nucleotide-binding universal stress UspA family protein
MLVGVNNVGTAERLHSYLESQVGPDDLVVVVNSRVGTDSADRIREGKAALAVFENGLDATVETHQYVRGESPERDLVRAVEEYEADELVIGFRKRRPADRLVFGSMSQKVLLNTPVPVRAVPLE